MLLRQNIICDLAHVKKYLTHTSYHCRDLVMWMLEVEP
jgi:hypothetical protein